jgi:hypothetical protein
VKVPFVSTSLLKRTTPECFKLIHHLGYQNPQLSVQIESRIATLLSVQVSICSNTVWLSMPLSSGPRTE